MTVESELHEAIEAVQAATALVREQEAKLAQMRASGIDTRRAESLLAAYRAAARYATERRDWLQAKREAKTG
jgi:hypothetical protein